MRIVIVPLMMLMLLDGSAYAAGDAASTRAPLTEKQAKRVDELLAGKVAGKPQQCIKGVGRLNALRVSDGLIIYRVNSKLVYRNELRGRCPGLADKDKVIVANFSRHGHCQGDGFRLVDRFNGIMGPVCALGEFVPYKAADKAS